MKTMNNNNNIENKKNVVVANNAAAEPAEAVKVSEESRKAWNDAYGAPAINESRGWKLDHVIQFDFYHNAYVKSQKEVGELVQMVCAECGIKPEETDNWAKDIRRIITYVIETYDEILDEDGAYEGPDDCNRAMSGQMIGDAIEIRNEAYDVAEEIMPHTFDEEKEYYDDGDLWQWRLDCLGVTEEERKAYLDSLPRTDI